MTSCFITQSAQTQQMRKEKNAMSASDRAGERKFALHHWPH
jgi:hypothetical protein